MAALTDYQKRLVRELREIYDLLSLDFYDIKAYPKKQRTTRLELMRRAAIRQEVVTKYTLIDEYLASELSVHYLRHREEFSCSVEDKEIPAIQLSLLRRNGPAAEVSICESLEENSKDSCRRR
jgi:hypothetical protein